MPHKFAIVTGFTAILFAGAIFGFFYAWVCSTMWGLDETDPHIAIPAMQAINASVRNVVFFPAFFLTPVVLAIAAVIAYRINARNSAALFLAAALLYLVGAFLPTLAVNVPMNEALAAISVPEDPESARTIWLEYSLPWQSWNLVRTVATAAVLLLCAGGLYSLRKAN
ncbi:MAG: DUF1772 domain-containing protein [Rhizobiaceae bacterium]